MSAPAPQETPTPVNIVTGFLGSGKTTLLRQSLDHAALASAAVLINEFGEAGLDHLLLEKLDDDIVLLQSGCVCCTMRGDVAEALQRLSEQRSKGSIPNFDRVVIETTGLADPVPLLATLMHEPFIRNHFRPAAVITTVDAMNAARHIAEHEESRRQIAVAERVILTKTDIASADDIAATRTLIRTINGAAPLVVAPSAELDIATIFARDFYDPAELTHEAVAWLEAAASGDHKPAHDHGHAHAHSVHSDITTLLLEFDAPIDWGVFGLWLAALLHRHGDRILRTKGILSIANSDTPVVVHGVQNLVHPPMHLTRWPWNERRSKLIFITRGIEAEELRHSLREFLRALAPESEHVQ